MALYSPITFPITLKCGLLAFLELRYVAQHNLSPLNTDCGVIGYSSVFLSIVLLLTLE